MTAAHSILAPSSMARTVQCAGSVSMQKQYPEREDSPSAIEGRAAHWVMEQALRYGLKVTESFTVTPDGVEITDEMRDGAEMMVGAVDQFIPMPRSLNIEAPVACHRVHPECWGTPDVWANHNGLVVIDYKFGHDFVEAFENWQLVTYAVGILEDMGIDGQKELHFPVTLVIVQPRNYHKNGPIRPWKIMASDLRAMVNIAAAACNVAMQPDAPTKTGPECDFCSARHVCPTLQAKAMRAVEISGQSVPHELTPAAAGGEYKMLADAIEALKARSSGLEEYLMHTLRTGTRVPGIGLEASAGREVWARPLEEIFATSDALGVNVRKPSALTPKQAIKAGLAPEVVQAFTEKRSGAVRLVIDDGSKTRKAFTQQ
jgi:hypothetical protein